MIVRSAIVVSLLYFSFAFAMDKDKDSIQITSSMPQQKLFVLDLDEMNHLDLSQVEKVEQQIPQGEPLQSNVESYVAHLKDGNRIHLTHFHKGRYAGDVTSSKTPAKGGKIFLLSLGLSEFNKAKTFSLEQIKKDAHGSTP